MPKSPLVPPVGGNLMHMDWILNPLAQYGMLAAGLIACLGCSRP